MNPGAWGHSALSPSPIWDCPAFPFVSAPGPVAPSGCWKLQVLVCSPIFYSLLAIVQSYSSLFYRSLGTWGLIGLKMLGVNIGLVLFF